MREGMDIGKFRETQMHLIVWNVEEGKCSLSKRWDALGGLLGELVMR